mgnify:CR=1 FL=1
MRRNEVKAKPAFRPLPRSSVPVTPNHEVVMPLLPTVFLRSASPAMRMEPTYMSARPDSCTELCACANGASSDRPARQAGTAKNFLSMDSLF